MDETTSIVNFVKFLETQVIVPRVDEVYKNLGFEIKKDQFDQLCNIAKDKGSLFIWNDFISTENNVEEKIHLRNKFESSARVVVKSLQSKIKKNESNVFLVIGGFSNNKYLIKFFIADNSERLIRFRFIRKYAKSEHVIFDLTSAIENFLGSRYDDRFYILNSVPLYNSHKLYESLLGKILFGVSEFPNYPIGLLSGIKVKNRLEFTGVAPRKDRQINKILKIIGY